MAVSVLLISTLPDEPHQAPKHEPLHPEQQQCHYLFQGQHAEMIVELDHREPQVESPPESVTDRDDKGPLWIVKIACDLALNENLRLLMHQVGSAVEPGLHERSRMLRVVQYQLISSGT